MAMTAAEDAKADADVESAVQDEEGSVDDGGNATKRKPPSAKATMRTMDATTR
jgi:hypothetical protein